MVIKLIGRTWRLMMLISVKVDLLRAMDNNRLKAQRRNAAAGSGNPCSSHGPVEISCQCRYRPLDGVVMRSRRSLVQRVEWLTVKKIFSFFLNKNLLKKIQFDTSWAQEFKINRAFEEVNKFQVGIGIFWKWVRQKWLDLRRKYSWPNADHVVKCKWRRKFPS